MRVKANPTRRDPSLLYVRAKRGKVTIKGLSAGEPAKPKPTIAEEPNSPEILQPVSEPQRAGGPMPQPPPKQFELITLDDDDDPMDVENNSTAVPLQGISVEVEELSATDFQPAVVNVKLFRIGEDGPTNIQQMDPEQRFQFMDLLTDIAVNADGRKVVFDTNINTPPSS